MGERRNFRVGGPPPEKNSIPSPPRRRPRIYTFSTWEGGGRGPSLQTSKVTVSPQRKNVNDVSLILNVNQLKPVFGDHDLVMAELCISRPSPKVTLGRDWHNYS